MSSFIRNSFCASVILFSLICTMAQAAAAQKYSLSSTVGEGAQGNLVTSTQHFDQGTEVPYAFTPVPGYSSALVVIDGVEAPASGIISMNANHWLWAFGNPESGTQFSNMMTVPADFTKIPYPEFYQQRPSFDFAVADPYCAITSEVVAYPSSYLGVFPMPSIQGAPLPPTNRRGANLKDYWAYGLTNPTTNQGCSGDLHQAFIATLERLKKLGVDHVGVYRDTAVVDTNADPLSISDAAPWSISDSEMAWIVAQARTFGLEVYEYRQIVPEDLNNVPLPTAPTEEWASKYLDAFTEFIVGRATVAQQIGVDAFELDWGVYWIDWTPYKDLFISKMTAAAQQVRSVYSGKILYGQTAPWISGDATLLNNIDLFIAEPWYIQMTAEENANLTVPMVKQKYLDSLTALANALGPNRKPMVWQLFAQSHRNWLLSGWVEDGFCVNGCMQQSIEIDFSVQAIAYEAMLEAIAEQTVFTTASVDAKAYWYVDVMLPKDSFPNLSQSWRNKPAESILYQWFRRFDPLDFDGDSRMDTAVYDPTAGNWFFVGSNAGFNEHLGFGGAGYLPAPGDYDGDGKADLAVYDTSNGNWFTVPSKSEFKIDPSFGGPGYIPVPGDYDGDGKVDIAVYETSSGNWFYVGSTSGFGSHLAFGGANFIPVPADYDGDGKTDTAVYDKTNGNWFIDQTTAGFTVHPSFGGVGFLPFPGDYDGDGKTDIAVHDKSSGNWFYVGSTSGFGYHLAFGGTNFTPVPGDYDGDGKTDTAVYDTTNGNWFIDRTTMGFTVHPSFGGPGYVPVLLQATILRAMGLL